MLSEAKSASGGKKYRFPDIVVLAACLLLFFIPLIPDEKITRWKLWVLESGLFAILLIWFLQIINSGTIRIKNSALIKPISVWMVFIGFMYWTSSSAHIAELELFRVIVCFLSFFIFLNIVTTQNNREFLINFWLVGGFLSALYGILTHYGGFWIIRTPQTDRIFSTFGNPIFFAAFLVVTIPFLVYRIVSANKFLPRFLWIVILVPFLIALYFTKCRAGWLGFGVSNLILIFVILKSKMQRVFFILIFILAVSCFTYKTKNVWARQQGHLLIWRDSIKMVLDKPVFGVGLGAFIINFPNYASDELKKIWPLNRNIVNDAHSEFVQLLTETGIVGFGLFLWIIVVFFLQFRKFYNSTTDKNDLLLQVAGVSSVCGLLLQNMFSVDMRFTISSFYLFTVFGIMSSYSGSCEIKIQKSHRVISLLCLLAGVSFLEYHMVVKQYKSWRIVFESKDFLDKKIINSEEQKKLVQKMIASNPDDARLYFKLGYIWANEIKTNKSAAQKAIENFSRAAILDPAVENGGAFNNLGNTYYTLGNTILAKENYIKALNINPKLIDAHLNLGIAYYNEGKLKESAFEFEKVLKLDPQNASAIHSLKRMRE